MKKLALIFALSLVATVAIAAPALPAAPEDIRTGSDLAAACHALVGNDTSDASAAAATACRHFLGTMVLRVYKATPAGMPTQFNRIGPKGDETACFRLPSSLKYTDFAVLVLSYFERHPEIATRPAFELGARTLATNYPCKD